MSSVAVLKPKDNPLEAIFAAARDRLPGSGVIADARAEAFAAFARQGLPHRRIEDWKYTDLRAQLGTIAPLAPVPQRSAQDAAAAVLAAQPIAALTLVLIDGAFAPGLSDGARLPEGVTLQTLQAALDSAAGIDLLANRVPDPMLALNAAMATDGVVVEIAEGAALAQPIHLVHVATRSGTAAYNRSRLVLGNAARATLIESFIAAAGAQSYQTSDMVTVAIGDGAELQHVRFMEEAHDAFHIAGAAFTLGARARLNSFNLTVGGRLSRYQASVTFAGEGSDVVTNGVALLGGRRHADTTLVVDHAVPGCTSRENFRAVLDDRGHSVFQGRIVVRPEAQKTDGKMMTRALLLSDEAEVDNKPELEIFADDVTCGHGATAGALDESLLFYLRARGLPEAEAEALLIEAFVGEAVETIVDDGLREVAATTAKRWLKERG
jgi:Fe-S cluster assembly protein SufD